jgi:hypothetical protein
LRPINTAEELIGDDIWDKKVSGPFSTKAVHAQSSLADITNRWGHEDRGELIFRDQTGLFWPTLGQCASQRTN